MSPPRPLWPLLAVLLAGTAHRAHAADLINLQLRQAEVEAQLTPDNVLLLAVELDSLTVTDSLAAYGDPADPLVPLGELARLLDLDLEVAPARGEVTGRIGEARRPFSIDIPHRLVRIAGRASELPDVGVTVNDVYVRASAVESLLPIRLEADGESMLLRVIPREKLPIQARLERMARLRDLMPEGAHDETTLTIATPYRAFSAPAFDVSFDLTGDREGALTRRTDVRAAGDLLGMGYQAYFGADERGRLADSRLLFERRDADGGLLGPLGARTVSAGDVFTPGLSIGPSSHPGRGFSFSTGALDASSVFDRIDLRGELPAGSDVELYVNDVLRGGQRAAVNGRYEFLDVTLVRGVNVVTVVTYGPRGEKREDKRVIHVGGGQLKAGESSFDVGVAEQGRTLIPRVVELAEDPAVGGLRAVANLAYGVSTGLTLVGGAGLYGVTGNDERRLATLGARTSLLGVALQADAAADQTGGSGYVVGAAAQRLGVSAVLRHAAYQGGLVDENYAADPGKPLMQHTELTADTALPVIGSWILPLSLRVQRQAFADDTVTSVAAARVSTTIAGTLLSTGVDLYDQTTPSSAVQRANGVVAAARTTSDGWQLRGSLDYDLGLIPGITSGSLTADREISDRMALRFGVGEVFGSEETSVQAGALFRTPVADVSLSSDYSADTEDLRFGLRFAFGMAAGLRGRGYALTRPGPATGASARFHAFVDDDGDGVFDPDEAPMPAILVEGGERRAVTGAHGRAALTGLGSSATARLQVNLDKVEDPFLTPPPLGVEFAPRAGLVFNVPYPLTPTGEVLTRILIARPDGRRVGVSALRLRLLTGGQSPLESTTEFDGSAVFQQLRPGRYSLELDPDQASRLGLRLRRPVQFQVDPGGGALPDVVAEVTMEPLVRPMMVADAGDGRDLISELLGAPATADLIADLLSGAPAADASVPVADRIGDLLAAGV